MPNLPSIPGARKRGVVFLSSEDDFKKLDDYLINDTVCIDGPAQIALKLARLIQEKYKVGIKLINTMGEFNVELPADIEVINSPIQKIVGEGRAEAVKFKDGKAVGVGLVLLIEKAPGPCAQGPGKPQESDNAQEMTKALAELGTKGTEAILNRTRQSLDSAISRKGQDAKIGFPETN